EGLMEFNTDYYKRYGLTAKFSTKLTDQLTASYSMRFLSDEYQRPSSLTNSFFIDLGRQGWPTLPLYDPNGYLYSSPSPALNMRDGGIDNNQKDFSYHQLQLVFEPLKGWKTFGDFNYRSNTVFRHWDTQLTYNHNVAGNPIASGTTSEIFESGFRQNYFNVNLYSEYSKTIAEKNNFKVMAGFQSEYTKNRDLSAQRRGIVIPELPSLDLTTGFNNGQTAVPGVNGKYLNVATQGVFGRLNYDYDGRYLLEANLRYDASSRFRSDTRWDLFPGVSAGWNIARESFMSNLANVVNTLKFRASYGELGNQNVSEQTTVALYPTYLNVPFGAANGNWLQNGAKPNTAGAPNPIST
ncbi:MAG TPA: SusC/RagA family protein, partial [Bacillota bacterium]|nr:SusC/RagA family protein [Bacillota bacterium]